MLSVKIYVNFVKNTMMKGMIVEKTKEDVIAFCKRRNEEMTRYIKNLEKLRNVNRKKKVTAEEVEEMERVFEEEKGELEKRVEEMTVKGEEREKEVKKMKTWMMASLAGNLVLLLIILSLM